MERPDFVDCHSHVLPSGDDGVSTVAEGGVLCREAARRGTAILFRDAARLAAAAADRPA